MAGQVIVPPPGMVLKEAARHADGVGHRVQLLPGVGEQVAELAVAQARAGIRANAVYVASHVRARIRRRLNSPAGSLVEPGKAAEEVQMAWVLIVIAGLLETGFA